MGGVCVITGGSRGIGRSAAGLAAAAGQAVAVNYRNDAEAAAAVVRDIGQAGGRAVAIQADVARPADIVRLFEEAERALGPVTALVNSAGISHNGRVAELEAEALQRLMAVNVTGLMLCCREAVRRMSTAMGGKGGAIVNVSSMAATIGGRPGASAYAASKAAVDVFSTGLAKEVAAEGIRVNVVRPGVTLTDMTGALRDNAELREAVAASIAMQRVAEPREVAEAIVWLLSDKASFVAGSHLNVGGGGFLVHPAMR
jgi:NAD(P)-dependent dehydrogenase (short-subunit alcohol dehydrogenase family)